MKKKVSLDLYKSIVSNFPFSIILLDPKRRIIYMNPSAENLYDIILEDNLNEELLNLIEFVSENSKDIVDVMSKEGKSLQYGPCDTQIISNAGKTKWLNITFSEIEIETINYKQIYAQDITPRKLKELDLKSLEMRYKMYFENATDLFIVIDQDFEIKYINSSVHYKIMGYTEEDLLNQNPVSLIHPKDKKLVIESIKDALKEGEGTVISRIRHKDGHYIWFESNGRVFQNKEGKPLFMIISRDISERIKTQNKLKESQQRYRDLANTLPEVIFELDLKYNLIYTNLVASEIFGYSHNDFLKGLTVFDFIHPEEKDKILLLLKRLYNGEQIAPTIIRLRKKDGTYIFTRIIATPILKNAEVVGIRSIIHDITEMMKAQKRIEESENKFRTIAEQSLLGISIIQDQKVKYANKVLAEILGYSLDEIKKWEPGEFFKTIHPDDKKMILEYATAPDEQFENGIRLYEARAIHKSGKTIWVEVYYKKIQIDEKPAFLVSYLDITQEKEARQKLKESEQKYRFLFENAPFGIILIDRSGKIRESNPAVETLIGYKSNEIIGKKYSKLLVVKKEYLPLLLKRLSKIKDGENLPPLDVELRRKDGSHVWANIESSLMNVGDKVFIIVMGHDVSEKKQAEQKLKDLDKLRKEFIDNASHELKTPITTVYGSLQLLFGMYKDFFSTEQFELIEMAYTGATRLKKLTDDLLDVSRLESNKFIMKFEPTDLSKVINNCITELRYLTKRRNQTVEKSLPKNLIADIDKSRIELVVTNLLTNSIKYTPINGFISIKLNKINGIAELSIKDSGIGLTKDEIQELFKKFTKIANPYEDKIDIDLGSTGLGLHIAREIVLLHNGSIKAESPGKNKGSTFTVRLPLKRNNEKA